MPTEQEMLPKDKYTVFDRKVKRYRKGIHSKFSSRPTLETDLVEESAGAKVREAEIGEMNVLTLGQMLTVCRGAKVDESQPETESPWFLSGECWFCVYYMFLYGLHRIWRLSRIKETYSVQYWPTSATACFFSACLMMVSHTAFQDLRCASMFARCAIVG